MEPFEFEIVSRTYGRLRVVVPGEVRDAVLTRAWCVYRVKRSRPGVLYAMSTTERGTPGRRNVLLHRFVWEKLGREPSRYLDHIDGNPLNNSLENLRAASPSLNAFNRHTRPGKSGVRGVTWEKRDKCWRVEIGVAGKSITVGRFRTIESAAAARRCAENRYYGDVPLQPGVLSSP